MDTIWDDLRKLAIDYLGKKGLDFAGKLVGAVVILVAGGMLARYVGRMMERALAKQDLEPPVRNLMVRIVRLVVFMLVLVVALDQLGVPIMPLIAGISVAGVGIGLAMQGVLSNLVAGLVIIFTKPYRVGEYIEIVGVQGTVTNVDLLTTMLQHSDLSRIKIPNRKVIGEILHNYGRIRQLDLSVGVAYATDMGKALAVVNEILRSNPRVLKDPVPAVGISGLGDSSVNIAVRPWVDLKDFGSAGGEINQAILERFRESNIEMPFPQREIRLLGGGMPPQA